MKLMKFNLLIIAALLLSVNMYAKDSFEKKENKVFSLNENSKFVINNKFGSINIENNQTNQLVIDVVIKVEAGSKEKADKVFDKISIKINEKDNVISAITDINGSINNTEFSIDYYVKMPAGLSIDLSNKFGPVVINSLTGNAVLNVEYGNLQADILNFKKSDTQGEIHISYGAGDIKSISNANMSVKYSGLMLKETNNIKLETRFSSLEAENIIKLTLDSKYDNIEIKRIEDLIMDSKFSNVEIEEISKSLILDFEYGNFNLNNVLKGFSEITINNKFGEIEISMADDVSYIIDARSDNSDIDIPESPGVKVTKEGNGKRMSGIVGKDKNTISKIVLVSKFGNINLD